MLARLASALACAGAAAALDNGLGIRPQMGWNSWNCYGSGVNAADLKATADFFVSSGLRDAGYEYVSTDERVQQRAACARMRGRARQSTALRSAMRGGLRAAYAWRRPSPHA